MSVASAIRAGLAYVELFLDDKRLKTGLKATTDGLKTWARASRASVRPPPRPGLAIEGGLLLAVRTFIDTGDQLEKLSIRTGMSVEQLACSATRPARAMQALKTSATQPSTWPSSCSRRTPAARTRPTRSKPLAFASRTSPSLARRCFPEDRQGDRRACRST